MSHTTTIGGIVISDMDALNAAIAELNTHGINCELLKGAQARAYYGNQKGMENPEYTIHLKDCRYDVGLYRTQNGDGLEARADFWEGHIERQLGVTPGPNDDHTQAKIGKLYNTYAVQAASRKAIQQGMRVQRVNHADGSVQLRIAV
jgi:hypothetical protein